MEFDEPLNRVSPETVSRIVEDNLYAVPLTLRALRVLRGETIPCLCKSLGTSPFFFGCPLGLPKSLVNQAERYFQSPVHMS